MGMLEYFLDKRPYCFDAMIDAYTIAEYVELQEEQRDGRKRYETH
jgi:hypothetical protein